MNFYSGPFSEWDWCRGKHTENHKNSLPDKICRKNYPVYPGPEVKYFLTVFRFVEHEIFSANKYENAKNSWHSHIY